MKVCDRCGRKRQDKSFRLVHDNRTGKNYVYRVNVCKFCTREIDAAKREKNKNNQEYLEMRRRAVRNYRLRHPERVREKVLRYKADPKSIKKRKRYYNKNRDKLIKQNRANFKKNKNKITTTYIVGLLATQTGLNRKELREDKQLIETYKSYIKFKRLCKRKSQTSTL